MADTSGPETSSSAEIPASGALARPTTLYRRYRPTTFSEVYGQQHVSDALRNAVRGDRVGHAYLFSGPRGTGKTTTARLLAKLLNCTERGESGEPCGHCENCVAIANGEFYDLVELDAASNRGVDAMRDLIQSVSLGLGASSRRKVYVVDEVHMLTPDASNALLKTLEEPPAHVVFVLATTEPAKVLPTIRSRTQHFEFGLLDLEVLIALVDSVLEREGVDSEPGAVELIARRAAGSARDALSLLDQALALGEGSLDVDLVRRAFGEAPLGRRLAVLAPMLAHDAAGALAALAEILHQGTDPRRLVDELLRTARDAFVLSASDASVNPPEMTADDRASLQEFAQGVSPAALTRAIDVLGNAVLDIRGPAAPDARLVLEVAVVRLAQPRSSASTDSTQLEARIATLERQVAQLLAGNSDSADSGSPAERNSRAKAAGTESESTRPPPSSAATAPDEGGSRSGPKPALGALGAKTKRPSPQGPISGREPGDGAVRAADADTGTRSDPSSTGAAPTRGALALDDVISAWPGVLGALSPPVRSQVDLAQPVSVDGDVVVFGAPSVHVKRINTKFRENADAIRGALAAALNVEPKLKVVADDAFAEGRPMPEPTAGSASGSGPASQSASPPVDESPPDDALLDDVVDLTELVDAPEHGGPVDSASKLVDAFDATIVDENSRT